MAEGDKISMDETELTKIQQTAMYSSDDEPMGLAALDKMSSRKEVDHMPLSALSRYEDGMDKERGEPVPMSLEMDDYERKSRDSLDSRRLTRFTHVQTPLVASSRSFSPIVGGQGARIKTEIDRFVTARRRVLPPITPRQEDSKEMAEERVRQ